MSDQREVNFVLVKDLYQSDGKRTVYRNPGLADFDALLVFPYGNLRDYPDEVEVTMRGTVQSAT